MCSTTTAMPVDSGARGKSLTYLLAARGGRRQAGIRRHAARKLRKHFEARCLAAQRGCTENSDRLSIGAHSHNNLGARVVGVRRDLESPGPEAALCRRLRRSRPEPNNTDPLILIHGILGSKLRTSDGKDIWPARFPTMCGASRHRSIRLLGNYPRVTSSDYFRRSFVSKKFLQQRIDSPGGFMLKPVSLLL